MPDYDGPTTSFNIESQPWYCGLVTRINSEKMLTDNGDFLVRDSISMPGEYVLTAMWNGRPLHFQINTVCENGKKHFHLEEESFASVAALINFYRSHRRPVTAASGCIISTPVDRTREAATCDGSELEASYMHVLAPHAGHVTPRSLSRRVLLNQTALRQQRPRSTIGHDHTSTAPDTILVPPVPAALRNRPLPLPIRSPRNTQEVEEDYSEMDYDAMDGILDASSTFDEKVRSSSTASLPGMCRQFQSCHNLSYRSQSPSMKIPSPIPTRPPLPPRPNLNVAAVEKTTAPCQLTETNNDDYDEPRTKQEDYQYDELLSSKFRNRDSDQNRLSASSDDSIESNARDSRDSGIYGSPSPPEKHHSFLSQVQMMRLKQFLLTKSADEIALATSHEHARLLLLLRPPEGDDKRADNGLRQVLLPSGAVLRQELLKRLCMLHYACLLSIISGARRDASLILRKWIFAGVSMARHGDAFACACIADTLSEPFLCELSWLWAALDPPTRDEYEVLQNLGKSLKGGENLERYNHATVIPFLQPVLEILTGKESRYLNRTNYAYEIDSLWKWLDTARDWSMRADELSKAATVKYYRTDGTMMTSTFLSQLVVGGSKPEDWQEVLDGVIRCFKDQP
ncbi:unnamed protein product [Cylicocyclus nassatus]|uniref:SH2 domain-containing protein n=1 Tax=Cylicocyclus nassatus TaxID=53992 RepID=A0AA36GV36_CYLNA|nr:unnamed protein product [Cylicocyclus nassatus]